MEINSEKCKSRLGYLVQLGGKPFESLFLCESSQKLPAFWYLQQMFRLMYDDLLSGNSHIRGVVWAIFYSDQKRLIDLAEKYLIIK